MDNCQRCTTLCASRTQIVFPDLPEFGRPCRILVVGEAPGADEDAQGQGFVGRAGRTLHALMEEHGMRRGYDYGCANVVRCRPPENRRPTRTEIEACLPLLADTISSAKPQVVLAVGDTAAQVFFEKDRTLGLLQKIEYLKARDYCPRDQLRYGEILDMRWPYGTKLAVMPHTSPLAWNRNTPDGRKWSAVGADVIAELGRWHLNTSSEMEKTESP